MKGGPKDATGALAVHDSTAAAVVVSLGAGGPGKRQPHLFDETAAVQLENLPLTERGDPESVTVAHVTPNYFALLGVPDSPGQRPLVYIRVVATALRSRSDQVTCTW